MRCSGPRVVYSFQDLAQKNREGLEVLTEAGIRTGRPCRVIGGEDWRWRSTELAEEGAGGCVWLQDPTGGSKVVLRRYTGAQGGSSITGDE